MSDERQKAIEKLVAEKLKRDLQPGSAACPDAGLIAAYVDRTLSLGERGKLETHAASCRRCQEAIAVLARLAEGDEPASVTVPSPRPAFAVWRWAWAAPLVLALVIVGVWKVGKFRERVPERSLKVSPAPPPTPQTAETGGQTSANAQLTRQTEPAAPAAKPAEKHAPPAVPKNEISKEEAAKAEGEPVSPPAPSPRSGATSDNVTPQAGAMATPSVRSRLATLPPPAPVGQPGATSSQLGGAGTGGAVGTAKPAEGKTATEQPSPSPSAVESAQKKTQNAVAGLAKESRMTTQTVEVTGAAPALEVAQTNKPQAPGWTVVRTPQAGTWRVGPRGAIQKLGKLGRRSVIASGTTADLYNLAFYDAIEGWAVGQSGTVLHTTDGGKTWTAVTSPTSTDLLQVTATGESAAQVTARDGAVFATTDGGATWNSSTRP